MFGSISFDLCMMPFSFNIIFYEVQMVHHQPCKFIKQPLNITVIIIELGLGLRLTSHQKPKLDNSSLKIVFHKYISTNFSLFAPPCLLHFSQLSRTMKERIIQPSYSSKIHQHRRKWNFMQVISKGPKNSGLIQKVHVGTGEASTRSSK